MRLIAVRRLCTAPFAENHQNLSVSLPPAQFRRVERLAKLVAAMRAIQESAKRAGLDKLTEREIDAEVTASRGKRDN
jgi:hypothetical protein